MTSPSHPALIELAELGSDAPRPGVEAHVAGCAHCQERLAALSGLTDARPAQALELDVGVSPRLSEAWQLELRPEPDWGQLWRCLWDDRSVLAIVWLVGEGDLTLIPASFDEHLADDLTLVLDDTESPVGVALGVWTGLESGASTAVLDRCLGQLTTTQLAWLSKLRQARRTGQLPADVPRGVRPGSPLDERAEYRTALERAFSALIAASVWEPQDAPGLAVRDVLTGLGVSPADLASRLSLEPRDVLSIFQGRRPLQPEEQEALATLAAESGEAHLASSTGGSALPLELVDRMNRPRWKSRIVSQTAERSLSEKGVRRHVADEARNLSVAARRPRSAPIDWDAILERVLG